MNRTAAQQGASATELLVALPVVLMLGLAVVQFAFVYQAKHALDHALTQAARQGAVDHASAESILRGLAAGLVPFLYGADDWHSLLAGEAKAQAHVTEGRAAGWIRLRQRSPTVESFDDWAVTARDAFGEPIAGVDEIPNDNLDNRRRTSRPASGPAGDRDGEPIGQVSGQTLADANLLRLELTYGVRLAVPLIGPIVLSALSRWDGCVADHPEADGPDRVGGSGQPRGRLGLMTLGGLTARDDAQPGHCAFYGARDASGLPAGRVPVKLSATVRMMSTPRRSELSAARVDSGTGLSWSGSGRAASTTGAADPRDASEVSGAPAGRPVGSGAGVGPGVGIGDAGNAGNAGRGAAPFQNGFLSIGSDRDYARPALRPARHPALCPD